MGRTTHANLKHNAVALDLKLAGLRPLSVTMTMVPAAVTPPSVLQGIDSLIARQKEQLSQRLQQFKRRLTDRDAEKNQRYYSFLRLRFNAILVQYDIFADVLTQRGEHGYGIWLAGLDWLARDALHPRLSLPKAPHMLTYLERGLGAAIRRKDTKLPGGVMNPVALIRIPRSRLLDSSIACSLVHEVGHQAVAILGLVHSLKTAIDRVLSHTGKAKVSAWRYFRLCISEIIADCWAISRLGITAVNGLVGVLSLPPAFIYRLKPGDPHPFPWIRVLLACAVGQYLFPHDQWQKLERLWHSYYPAEKLSTETRLLCRQVLTTTPEFLEMLFNHPVSQMGNKRFIDLFNRNNLQIDSLQHKWRHWSSDQQALSKRSPIELLAVIGQARWENRISPEKETSLITSLMEPWAMIANRKNKMA